MKDKLNGEKTKRENLKGEWRYGKHERVFGEGKKKYKRKQGESK